MLIDIVYQGILFAASILAGIIVGILFQMYKLIIRDYRGRKITVSIMDVLFWIISGIIVYYWLFVICNAIIGFYVILLIFIGIAIYYFILAPILESSIEFLIYKGYRFLRVFLRTIFYPLEILWEITIKRTKK